MKMRWIFERMRGMERIDSKFKVQESSFAFILFNSQSCPKNLRLHISQYGEFFFTSHFRFLNVS